MFKFLVIFFLLTWQISAVGHDHQGDGDMASPSMRPLLSIMLRTTDGREVLTSAGDLALAAHGMVAVFHGCIQANNNESVDLSRHAFRGRGCLPAECHMACDHLFPGWRVNSFAASVGMRTPLLSSMGLIFRSPADDHDAVVMVAFRGSQIGKDWEHNLFIKGRTSPHLQDHSLHGGYVTLFDRIFPQLFTMLRPEFLEAGEKKPRLIITGHSLGAAMATLFYAALRKNNTWKDVAMSLYVAGSPKVGGADFQAFMARQQDTMLSFARATDPVVSWPLFGGYCQAIGYTIKAPHYGAWRVDFDKAHDARRYREYIIAVLRDAGVQVPSYTPLYTKPGIGAAFHGALGKFFCCCTWKKAD